ncbi:MAG: transporter [Candidatus Marinimicrobia bacterium]|nr:transporter [Candidatus Neomarinimicrobiota bacterium]
MLPSNKMKQYSYYWLLLGIFILAGESSAGGISVDAGLTPAENRWMIRVQSRQMGASSQPSTPARQMKVQANVLMAAYGLRPNITLIGMQGWMNREMTMMGAVNESSGRADLNLIIKYLIHRTNTRDQTLGIAATTKLTLPTGEVGFSDDYWSFTPGVYLSLRRGTWAMDASTTYRIQDMFSQQDAMDRGWEYTLDGAVARQLPLGGLKNMALAPVLEFNLLVDQGDHSSSAEPSDTESVVFLSPGFKYTYGSMILESLIQVPVWESVPITSLEKEVRWRVGLRLMF